MLKTNLILGIISLFTVFGLIGEPVTLSSNMPETADAGSEFLVEVTIKKGDVEGFARFQQTLPVGLTAVARQTANGDFSFVDQKVKIQWMRVPYDREFVVSYSIQVDPSISGTFDIDGTFSYIMDNAVQTANLESSAIEIVNKDTAAVAMVDQLTYSYQNVSIKTVDCIRQKPYLNDDDEIIVNLMVNKGDLDQFGKIQEQVPVGYRAESIRSKNSIFTFKNHIVKFLWMNMPTDAQFIVSYKLVPEGEVPDQAFVITGTFSYAESDRTKTLSIAERSVELENFNEEELVVEEKKPIDEEESIANPYAAALNAANIAASFGGNYYSVPDNSQATRLANSTNSEYYNASSSGDSYSSSSSYSSTATLAERTSSSVNGASTSKTRKKRGEETMQVSTPAPERGVAYKVQIAAGHKLVGKNYFKRLNIKEKVQVEAHNGWNKYTIGHFNEYKDARDYRVYVWNNTPIQDAFVTAYNNGLRITVQEALMISNQKWYK
ncbi:MAG: hypothetical protein MJ069_00145 [Salinivirgaceae bacterium]|nr:hypothetical protein [Salinivirgaceae bacterium]